MASHYTRIAVLGATALMSGCAFFSESLWPTLAGQEPAPAAVAPATQSAQVLATPTPAPPQEPVTEVLVAQAPLAAAEPLAPQPAPSAYQTAALQQVGTTGTFVGAKVAQLNTELQALKVSIASSTAQFEQLRQVTRQNAQRYFATVAAITARLQVGTTPGNPVLVAQWNTAQAELDRVLSDIASVNTLANQVAADSSMTAFLLESARAAYRLSGAVDEDHRQLAFLEDDVNRTIVTIDRLLKEVNRTVRRQTLYVNSERRHLTTLSLAIKNGEIFGRPLESRVFAAAVQPATPRPTAAVGAAVTEARAPLVVIRFDRPDVPYKQALFTAVSQALERQPSAMFEVVAVAPSKGSPSDVVLKTNEVRRSAEQVLRALNEMGLPSSRVTLSGVTSGSVETNEVHIYVR